MRQFGTKLVISRTGLPRLNFARASSVNNRRSVTRVVKTFTANATWVAPITTSQILELIGEGADGTAATISQESVVIANVSSAVGVGSAGYTWGDLQAIVNSNKTTINGGGTGLAYDSINVIVHPDGTQTNSASILGIARDVVIGTAVEGASPGWNSSGPIAYGASGFDLIGYNYYDAPATTGASTTGFGKTFAGGIGGAATPATYINVAVTSGTSYTLVVPSGGSITITYMQ